MSGTPEAEIARRIGNLKGELLGHGLDGALILQRADLFYFTGTVQQASLYVPVDGDPVLMVNKSLERARRESSIERVVPLGSAREIPQILKQNSGGLPERLGMELDVIPVNTYLGYERLFEGTQIVDVSASIRLLRSVKSAYEIDLIRGAARLSDEVAGSVAGHLREGMTELELAGRLEAEARKRGHLGVIRMRLWGNEIFFGHLMSGPSAAEPSYLSSPTGGPGPSPALAQGAGFRPIQRHEPVLVDYVFAHQGYLADSTRIFSLGALPDDLVAAHRAMLDLQALVKERARPGVRSGDLYELALERARALGYEEHLMGVGKERVRFVGHGIGIEVDEFPFLAQGQDLQLKQGMTIAVEPKLIFPGKGVVGIENTHVVTPDGLEQLTQFEEEIQIV